MSPEGRPSLTEQWMILARGDLEFASNPPLRGGHYARLCFFAQQAAEKAVKAVMTARGLRFPFTHNLQALLELIPDEAAAHPELIGAIALTSYAAEHRYPPYLDSPDEDDWREALRLASAVVAWAEAALEPGSAPAE